MNTTVIDFIENYFCGELSDDLIEHIGTFERDKVLDFYDLFWDQSDSFFNTSREDIFPSPLIGICANAIWYRHTSFDLITITDMREKVDPVIENIKRLLVYYKTVTVPISDIEFQTLNVNRENFSSELLQNFVYLLSSLKPLITTGYVKVIPVKPLMNELVEIFRKNDPESMKQLHDPRPYLEDQFSIVEGANVLSDLIYCKYLNADFVSNRKVEWDCLNKLIEYTGFQGTIVPSSEQYFHCFTDKIDFPDVTNLTNMDIIALRDSSVEFHEWYNLTRDIMEESESLGLDSTSAKENFQKIANQQTFVKSEQIKEEIKKTSLKNHIKGAGITSIQAYAALKIAEPLLKSLLILEDELIKIAASGLVGLTELIRFRSKNKPKLALLHHLSLFSSND